MIPIMLAVVLNALNVGYFFFVTINLTSATRAGAEYAIVGPGSPGTTSYPNANTGTSSVAGLIYQEMTGAIWNATNASVQICSPSIVISGSGTSGTPAIANCVLCTSSSSCSAATATTGANAAFVPDADPEAPTFVLNRVDVKYSFPPLIPGTPFNLLMLGSMYNSGQYTFYRHIEMRAM